jgi:hypothetical protein
MRVGGFQLVGSDDVQLNGLSVDQCVDACIANSVRLFVCTHADTYDIHRVRKARRRRVNRSTTPTVAVS